MLFPSLISCNLPFLNKIVQMPFNLLIKFQNAHTMDTLNIQIVNDLLPSKIGPNHNIYQTYSSTCMAPSRYGLHFVASIVSFVFVFAADRCSFPVHYGMVLVLV